MGRPCLDRRPKHLRGFCTGTVPVPILQTFIKCRSSSKDLVLHCKHGAVCCSAEARLIISQCRGRGTVAVSACITQMQSAGHQNMSALCRKFNKWTSCCSGFALMSFLLALVGALHRLLVPPLSALSAGADVALWCCSHSVHQASQTLFGLWPHRMPLPCMASTCFAGCFQAIFSLIMGA